ncbi:MAG: GlxA family transcriptional regulator [Alphaproteobacteria bacterium]
MNQIDTRLPIPAQKIKSRRIAMFCFPDAQIIDVTGPLSVFATASQILAADGMAPDLYATTLLAADLTPVTTSCGIKIIPDQTIETADLARIDTLLIAGGTGVQQILGDRRLIDWIARAAGRVRRIASVCTGAFLLAEAGVLNGRRATTHWRHCAQLAHRYPAISVEPDAIHVRDRHVYSSAGVTAGMDLALALVEEDYDRALALAIARDKVMYLKRPGGQSQFSATLAAQSGEDSPFGALQRWILENLGAELSVPVLADRAAMSPRNFARLFTRHTGQTPARFVETARLDFCRRRLEESSARLESIAHDAGFGNAERLRKSFQRHFRISPLDYRRRFRAPAL